MGRRYMTTDAPYSDCVVGALKLQATIALTHGGKNKFRDKFRELVEGEDVIEIGASDTPMTFLTEFNPRSYVCVEPTSRRIEKLVPQMGYVNGVDGLVYLRQNVRDDSAVIVSSGLFDRDIIFDEQYIADLTKEIHAKTKPSRLTFHTFHHFKGMWNWFEHAGFEHDYALGCDADELDANSLLRVASHDIVFAFFRKAGGTGRD